MMFASVSLAVMAILANTVVAKPAWDCHKVCTGPNEECRIDNHGQKVCINASLFVIHCTWCTPGYECAMLADPAPWPPTFPTPPTRPDCKGCHRPDLCRRNADVEVGGFYCVRDGPATCFCPGGSVCAFDAEADDKNTTVCVVAPSRPFVLDFGIVGGVYCADENH